VAAAAGCSTAVSVNTLQPIESSLGRFKKAIVQVAAAPEAEWRDEARIVEQRLKFAMLDKLRASKKFDDATDELPAEPADSDLKIVLTIASLRSYPGGGYGGPSIGVGVGGGSWRGGGGGFFGLGLGTPWPAPAASGSLTVQVDLLDARTGKRLGYLEANVRSGNTTAQADAIAEKVVAEISGKY
jgi:hypothetical protein